MTASRRLLLNALTASDVPLTAAEIHRRLGKQFDLATIYRGLSYFERLGQVVSFSYSCSEEGTERYYHLHRSPHTHFFHCSSCHRFTSLGSCTLQGLEEELEMEHGVLIHEHTLYFTGLCRACSGGEDASHPPVTDD